ncbi:MAG TPA: PAS domain S-box protein [Arenimonas sp.]|nr:PAS domain S-box protein [Arenimonas sp.]
MPLFTQLFELVPDAMIVVDGNGCIEQANPQAERLFGYSAGGLHGVAIEALMPESVRGRHVGHRNGYMANPRLRPMGGSGQSLIGRRSDGSEFPVEIALSPVQTDEGRRVLASIRDISETQRARQALLRARYDSLVARVGQQALASHNEDSLLAALPSQLAEALSIEAVAVLTVRADLSRLHLRNALGLPPQLEEHAPWSGSADPAFATVMATGHPVELPDLAGDADSALTTAGFGSALLVPLLDRGKAMGVLLTLSTRARHFDHDALHCLQSIANMLSALIQRQRSEEQLAHAQRLEAIGQLTGGIAHDFNNMLTVVSGNLQLLELEADAGALELIGNARRAVEHGAALTAKLLAFARKQRLAPALIDVDALMRDLGGLLTRTLGDLVKLKIDKPSGLPTIHADPSQLESALLNLALNARDAMPRGGTLDISATALRMPEAPLGSELQPGHYLCFTVQDSGHGMPPEVLARAFEPFFTTKDVGKGSGLGLSMVYGFVRQSGGDVRIDSRLGYGTRIELFFPVAAASVVDAIGVGGAQSRAGGQTVLVVEDEPEVRKIAVAFLRSFGYEVLAADSAEAALPLLEQHPEIALLFSDVALGSGRSGAELGLAARQLRPALPVLLTSGYEHHALPEVAEAVQAFELLRKPYLREDLGSAIARLIAASS